MLFDCVRVCPSLGFHWICNREKRGVYVNWWWYQSWTIFLYYACWSSLIGENISIWMFPFRFESSCARDCWIWRIILHRGGSYLVVLSSGCGDFFYHESYCDESVIMTIYGFLNIQIFCDVSSGVELCPYMGNGCVYGLIWFPPSLLVFLGCIKNHTPYYSRVMIRSSSQSGWSLRNIHISNDYGSFYVDVFFPPSVPRFYRKWLYISNTVELLILREHLRTRSVLWWDSCCSSSFFLCCPFKFIYVLSYVLWYPLRFSHTNDGRFVFTSTCL